MTIFQSHPQPEKVALKSVESPESSLRFRQILQLRLDLAIVGRRGLGGMRFFVKKVLQINKQNIGCKHPMIQGPKLFVVTISWKLQDSSHHHSTSLNNDLWMFNHHPHLRSLTANTAVTASKIGW